MFVILVDFFSKIKYLLTIPDNRIFLPLSDNSFTITTIGLLSFWILAINLGCICSSLNPYPIQRKQLLFEIALSTPVGYVVEGHGEKLYSDKVTLVAPSAKQAIKAVRLQQFMQTAAIKCSALFSMFKKQDIEEEPKQITLDVEDEQTARDKAITDGSDTARTTILSSDIDIESGLSAFEDLAKTGCLMVNGKEIDPFQWINISELDKLNIFYHFVGVFIMPSLLSGSTA